MPKEKQFTPINIEENVVLFSIFIIIKEINLAILWFAVSL